MITFHRILVDIDALAPQNAALQRAAELASGSAAALTVVDVLPEVPNAARRFVTDAVERELIDDRVGRICVATNRLSGLPDVATGILRGKTAHALSAEAARGDFDLVIRRRGPDRADADSAARLLDHQLARDCPCSVWLLDRDAQAAPRKILAAVDVSRGGAPELAVEVLDVALRVAATERAELTVVHAYHLSGEHMLARYVPPQDIHQLRLDAEREAVANLEALVARAECGDVTPHIAAVYGEPESVITQFANAHGIELVVLGAVSRSGLARLVVGSTADRILRESDRSLLVVKHARPH